MKEELLNLDQLTEEERDRILLVLKRNEELQNAQDTRITEIKSQINALRMNAVLRQGEDGSKICSRCRQPFGFFFNSGEFCPQCKCKVCKTCREYTLTGTWVCVLCYKQRQLKALTGDWLLPTPQVTPEEEKSDTLNLSVPELVRKSIRRKSSHSNGDEDGHDNISNNRIRSTDQTINDIESSSEGSSVHDVEYPKESDKQKLNVLLTQSHQEAPTSPSNNNNNNTLVQKVSTKRYEDSDSCSSDNDEEIGPETRVQTHSLQSSTSAFSTGRRSPASDMEDGNDDVDGNGTSLVTSSHLIGHERFDDSSYRAHSELPDVDDLIVKSKARTQHSPLSSMTSSPTPSSVGQRLLDLANSDADDDQHIVEDIDGVNIYNEISDEEMTESESDEEESTGTGSGTTTTYVVEYSEPDDASDLLSVISETTEPSLEDSGDADFETIYSQAKAQEEDITGEIVSSDTDIDSVIDELSQASEQNMKINPEHRNSEVTSSRESVDVEMEMELSDGGSTVIDTGNADNLGKIEELTDDDVSNKASEIPLESMAGEFQSRDANHLSAETAIVTESNDVDNSGDKHQDGVPESTAADPENIHSFIDEMSFFCSPSSGQPLESDEVSPQKTEDSHINWNKSTAQEVKSEREISPVVKTKSPELKSSPLEPMLTSTPKPEISKEVSANDKQKVKPKDNLEVQKPVTPKEKPLSKELAEISVEEEKLIQRLLSDLDVDIDNLEEKTQSVHKEAEEHSNGSLGKSKNALETESKGSEPNTVGLETNTPLKQHLGTVEDNGMVKSLNSVNVEEEAVQPCAEVRESAFKGSEIESSEDKTVICVNKESESLETVSAKVMSEKEGENKPGILTLSNGVDKVESEVILQETLQIKGQGIEEHDSKSVKSSFQNTMDNVDGLRQNAEPVISPVMETHVSADLQEEHNVISTEKESDKGAIKDPETYLSNTDNYSNPDKEINEAVSPVNLSEISESKKMEIEPSSSETNKIETVPDLALELDTDVLPEEKPEIESTLDHEPVIDRSPKENTEKEPAAVILLSNEEVKSTQVQVETEGSQTGPQLAKPVDEPETLVKEQQVIEVQSSTEVKSELGSSKQVRPETEDNEKVIQSAKPIEGTETLAKEQQKLDLNIKSSSGDEVSEVPSDLHNGVSEKKVNILSQGNALNGTVHNSEHVPSDSSVAPPQKTPRKARKTSSRKNVTFKEEISSEIIEHIPKPSPRQNKKAKSSNKENVVASLITQSRKSLGGHPVSEVKDNGTSVSESVTLEKVIDDPLKPPRKIRKKSNSKNFNRKSQLAAQEDVLTPEILVRKKSQLKTTTWGEALLEKPVSIQDKDLSTEEDTKLVETESYLEKHTSKGGVNTRLGSEENGTVSLELQSGPKRLSVQIPSVSGPDETVDTITPDLIDTPTLDALSEKYNSDKFCGQYYQLSYGLDSPAVLPSPTSSETQLLVHNSSRYSTSAASAETLKQPLTPGRDSCTFGYTAEDLAHIPPSVNASENTDSSSVQEDSGNITATSQGSSPLSHSKNPSDMSLPSINVSSVDEEDEYIADIDTQPKTPSSTFHQTFGSLFSSLGGSRESIASYYSQAGGGSYGVVKVKGTIQFAVDYKYKVGTLEIVVKQCSELAAVDEKKQRSDAYVKTYLLPDRTRTGKRKTQVKKNSLDPVFNETLRYHLTKSELSNRTLLLTVWNHDRFGRNVFLGEVTLPLTYYNFSSNPQWYNLQEREEMEPSMMTYKGDLVVSLKYVPLENLLENLKDSPETKKKKKPKEGQLCALIKEAKNLTAVRANGYSDSFCKGYLLPEKGKSVKQKTEVAKKNLSPKWNYLFTFEDISFEELPDRCLELTVWDHDRFSSNDFLGAVRLNIGTGTTSKGKEVDWMDARGEEIAVWQSMIDKPNTWVDATLTLRASMDKVE